MRILFAVLLFLLPNIPALAQTRAPRPRPKLVLLIAVDQFRYDYFPRFRDQYTGGLKLLLDRGANFVDGHLEHYPSVTAVGHSTMLSGATPAVSGIIGNDWFDRESGKQVTSVSDLTVQPLGDAVKPDQGASPRRLLVSTLGDELKRADPGSGAKVIGLSMKDRSSILPVGRMADAAYWFDEATGQFISSTYYFKELPAWVRQFNDAKHPQSYVDRVWLKAAGSGAERRLPSEPGRALNAAIYGSPLGNELLELLVERAIEAEKLGQRGSTDLLSVSFSSNDPVGHSLGPDSPEVREVAIQTDRVLDRLFKYLDKTVRMANVLVVMTADHGVAPVPELLIQQKMPGGRVAGQFFDPIQKALEARFGAGKWLLSTAGSSPYFNYELMEQKNLDPAEVQKVAARAIAKSPMVSRVYTREQLLSGRAAADKFDQRVARSFNPRRSGDLEILLDPYWIRAGGAGATHGTPYNYDTHIPIVFMGPGIREGRYYQHAALNDVAPTLAALLDIETPSGSVGRVLHEMFLPEPSSVTVTKNLK